MGLAELVATLRHAIADERVLDAIARMPRDLFVPRSLRDHAYENEALPIGAGQTISQPLVVARMLELLDVHEGCTVLDIGTGSGWHAALLAGLGGRVISIERDERLSEVAAHNLAAAGVEGVELLVGDGWNGLPGRAPFDRINVAAAAPPDAIVALEDQLADRGRLVAPMVSGDQRLVVTVRSGDRLRRRTLEPVRFVPLTHGLAR